MIINEIVLIIQAENVNSDAKRPKDEEVGGKHVGGFYHRFCNAVYNYIQHLARQNELEILNRDSLGYRGSESYYISFNVLKKDGSSIDLGKQVKVRVSTPLHNPIPKPNEFLILIEKRWNKADEHKIIMKKVKPVLESFINYVQENLELPEVIPVVRSVKRIYYSNRILSANPKPGEKIPNATVVAKALFRAVDVEDLIQDLEPISWEKRGGGATVFTDKMQFDFAKYNDKLRINFITPDQNPKYRETKKESVREIIEQIRKWLLKDFGIS